MFWKKMREERKAERGRKRGKRVYNHADRERRRGG